MASYKLVLKDGQGNTKTITESHPNLTATEKQKSDAMNALGEIYNLNPVRIDLNSDTTVWTAI